MVMFNQIAFKKGELDLSSWFKSILFSLDYLTLPLKKELKIIFQKSNSETGKLLTGFLD